MPIFDKRERARKERNKRRKVIVVLLALVALLAAGAMVGRRAYHSVYMQPARFAPPPPPQFRAARKVYPYSIVPGGVFDPQELKETMRVDPVALEHYGDIRIEDLVPVRIQSPLQAYVSYRIGNKIYWTAKKLNIPRGELVLTDGRNMIRARCGNRIALRMREGKISEQRDKDLETIFDSPIPSAAPLPPALEPVIPLDGRHLEPPPPSDVAPTPEPESLVLCASGMFLILAGIKWKSRPQTAEGS
jgi:hypothetical protein